MSTPEFTPLNRLEEVLLAAQRGEVQPSTLFDTLYAGKVFIMIDRPLDAGGQPDAEAQLLMLNSPDGRPVIAMFTAPERATGWPDKAPTFRHGLVVDFRWLVGGIPDGVGLVLNPGVEVGVEMSPSVVQKLRAGPTEKAPLQ